MDRREALRLLAAGAALQLTPARLFALRQARALLASQVVHRTLDNHQNATVAALAEMIIPRTDTPGAADVGVNQFVELILTEWYGDDDRKGFLLGLVDVDTRAKALFGKLFVECSPEQQADIMSALGEKMIEDGNALAEHTGQTRESLIEPYKNFYHMLRHLTLTAYYTSEAGATAALNFQVIPDRYDGCTALAGNGGETEP